MQIAYLERILVLFLQVQKVKDLTNLPSDENCQKILFEKIHV